MTPYEEEKICEMNDIIERLESLRIDVNNIYADSNTRQYLIDKYERANEMLDDCIKEVKDYFLK